MADVLVEIKFEDTKEGRASGDLDRSEESPLESLKDRIRNTRRRARETRESLAEQRQERQEEANREPSTAERAAALAENAARGRAAQVAGQFAGGGIPGSIAAGLAVNAPLTAVAALVAAGAAAGVLTKAFKSLAETTVTLAEEAREFSGLVAQTAAIQERRLLLLRRQRSLDLEVQFADLTSARGDLAVGIEEIRTALVTEFLPLLRPLVRSLADIATLAGEVANSEIISGGAFVLREAFEQGLRQALAVIGIAPGTVDLIVAAVRKLAEDAREDPELDAIQEEIKDFLDPVIFRARGIFGVPR